MKSQRMKIMIDKNTSHINGGFCTECGYEVEKFEGLQKCPSCHTNGVPCSWENQRLISVNWHELRILVMWAENWARAHQLGRTVYSIANRIEAQEPKLAEDSPLSLAKELGILAKTFNLDVSSAELRRDIAEQTGEETGLIKLNQGSHHGCRCGDPECSYRWG